MLALGLGPRHQTPDGCKQLSDGVVILPELLREAHFDVVDAFAQLIAGEKRLSQMNEGAHDENADLCGALDAEHRRCP